MGKGGDHSGKAGTAVKGDTSPPPPPPPPQPTKPLTTTQMNQQKTTTTTTDDFIWSATDEPHATRRKLILKKYPEIKTLYGHCPMLKYKALLCIMIQLVAAYVFRHQFFDSRTKKQQHEQQHEQQLPQWLFWLTAYVVGGTCNHMLMMALHELSHNLGFKKMVHNRWFAIVCNIPIGVPSAVTFKRYHMDHHKYQGVDGIDVDIPTVMEGRIFNNAFTKFFFLVFQVAFYGLRPGLVNPKPPGIAEAINAAVVIGVDVAVAYFWGISALLYWLVSSWLGMGLHPVAGHFIAEHYVFPPYLSSNIDSTTVPETYSYYGFCNYFTFNVGYHNEHHDFPFVPGSRLPLVKKIAAEFYDPLPQYTSYVKVMYDYVTCPQVTAFSRVKRAATAPDPDGVVTDTDAVRLEQQLRLPPLKQQTTTKKVD